MKCAGGMKLLGEGAMDAIGPFSWIPMSHLDPPPPQEESPRTWRG